MLEAELPNLAAEGIELVSISRYISLQNATTIRAQVDAAVE